MQELQTRKCSMGWATEAAISHFLKLHPEIPDDEARSLVADRDTSKPLYFWQLYSVLGTERIVRIVQNLYSRIAADKEEPWLPNAFTRISDWDHHVATQAAFWLDAMGKGRCYHGGEGRLQFHHHHNARHVMTQQGAARWMHHMRMALDESDLGTDPRVRDCIDAFLHARMEKYAGQFGFQTGDRVYKEWHPNEWLRTQSWKLTGPEPAEPKRCPIMGQVGNCEMTEEVTTIPSVARHSSSDPDKENQQTSGKSISSDRSPTTTTKTQTTTKAQATTGKSETTKMQSKNHSSSGGFMTKVLNGLWCRKF